MRHYVTGKVTGVERLGATVYGNPIMRVSIDGETFRLADNAGLAYGIANPEYRERRHLFELSPAGRLTGRVYDPCLVYTDGYGRWCVDMPASVGHDETSRRAIARRLIRDELAARGEAASRLRVELVGRAVNSDNTTYREV